MNNCSEYVALGKSVFPGRVSDRELGVQLGGYAQSTIAEAKAGQMSDAVALALGDLLVKHRLIAHAGEVILVAHAQRKTGRVRTTLLDFAKNVVSPVPSKVASVVVGAAVALGMMFSPAHDAQAFGGAGVIHTLRPRKPYSSISIVYPLLTP